MASRNDPCPCGSGKKFKECCLLQEHVPDQQTIPSGKFSFAPGSYGGPGFYCPSIVCKKHTSSNTWQYHFVLAKADDIHQNEESACLSSEDDLNNAFKEKGTSGSDYDMAAHLKRAGYKRVEGFKVIEEEKQENG